MIGGIVGLETLWRRILGCQFDIEKSAPGSPHSGVSLIQPGPVQNSGDRSAARPSADDTAIISFAGTRNGTVAGAPTLI